MKGSDIKRVIDEGLADMKMTEQSMDAVMRRIREAQEPHPGRARKMTAVVAIVLALLLLSVVAQAMGVPVWETFVAWTKEHLSIVILHTGNVEEQPGRERFSELERQTWGDDICKALEDTGHYPALPTWKPEEYEPLDLFCMDDESGYVYVSALYCDEDDNALNFMLEILSPDSHEYGLSVERDEEQRMEFTVDGTSYYLVSNLDTNTAVWQHENVMYQLSGPLSFDTLKKVISSIQYDDKESG